MIAGQVRASALGIERAMMRRAAISLLAHEHADVGS